MISLEMLNTLLKQAKAANNHLRHPDLIHVLDSGPAAAVTAHKLYNAIVAVEDELRANGGLVWCNDHWAQKTETWT